jgi:hypothetical protein
MALTLGPLPLYIVPSPLAYTTSKVVLFARVERALDTVLLEGILSPARTRDLPVSTIMAERQQRETANFQQPAKRGWEARAAARQ